MIWFNGSDLISPKANNGLLQPRLQHDDDDDDDDDDELSSRCFDSAYCDGQINRENYCSL